jgi:hypothetical protein
MTGRPHDSLHARLASGPQLWRLNTLGRLRLVDDALPISSSAAKATIGAELNKLGLSRFRGQARHSSLNPDSSTRHPDPTLALKARGRGLDGCAIRRSPGVAASGPAAKRLLLTTALEVGRTPPEHPSWVDRPVKSIGIRHGSVPPNGTPPGWLPRIERKCSRPASVSSTRNRATRTVRGPVNGTSGPMEVCADRNQVRRRRRGSRSARSPSRARPSAAPPRRIGCGDARGRVSSRRRARPRTACRRCRS